MEECHGSCLNMLFGTLLGRKTDERFRAGEVLIELLWLTRVEMILFNLCSLGSVMQLVLSIAFRGIYTETPSYLQIVDNGIAAYDADKGIIL